MVLHNNGMGVRRRGHREVHDARPVSVCAFSALLKIKIPKGSFLSNAIEEPFLVPQKTFQATVIKRTIFCV